MLYAVFIFNAPEFEWVNVSISFAQYRFHSFNSCYKVDGLGRSSLQYCNTSASSSASYCCKLLAMILTALKVEATLPQNLSLNCFLRNLLKIKKLHVSNNLLVCFLRFCLVNRALPTLSAMLFALETGWLESCTPRFSSQIFA